MLESFLLGGTLLALIVVFFSSGYLVFKGEVNKAYNEGDNEAVRHIKNLAEGKR